MLYSEQDSAQNSARIRKELLIVALIALPFALLMAVAFRLRVEWLCIVACFALGSALILGIDLKIMPLARYGRFLKNLRQGLTRRTAGTLVRISEEPVYEEGVWMRECILNIYEDQSPEGERRFLLDCAKEIPQELIGRDVALTSQANAVLDVCALENAGGQA